MSSQLAIYRYGSGPPIVLLHGWGMNAAIFKPLLEFLTDDFEVVVVDLPGHGKSALGEQGFDQQVDELASVLPRSILLGWSLGGLYAIALAHRYPEKFSHLLLVASNPRFVQDDSWPCAVPRQIFDEFSDSLTGDWQATIKRFIGLQLHGADQARQLIRQITQLLFEGGAPHPDALDQGLELLLKHDARASLQKISQPVLMMLGRRDTLVPISLEQQIRLLCPSIRVECFAHSAHVPFVSHPQQFADLIREFTQSSPAR